MDNYKPQFGYPIAPWHSVFAWLPKDTVDKGYIWMRRIYRRRIQANDYLYNQGSDRWWQYISERPDE